MRIDRLQRLIALLKTVPPGKLRMDSWTCGTAACAAGWAARDPSFIAEGLHLEPYGGSPVLEPVYVIGDERLDSFDALDVFFELTNSQCLHIFASHTYENGRATPPEVIARIEQVLGEA